VIATGVADDAMAALLNGQRSDFIERATNLECADWLEVFRLKVNGSSTKRLGILQ
jgi:hypothetical protein